MSREDKLKNLSFLVVVLGACILASGCTAQQQASYAGGTAEMNIPQGEKLVSVSWKGGGHLWFLTRPMREGEKAETYTLQENSSFGIVQGKFILHESNK